MTSIDPNWIIRLLVLAYLLIMVALWAKYGLFSAFLHLVLVFISVTLAFAFWEVIAVKLLLAFPQGIAFGWGTALVVPFAVFLFTGRMIMDKAVGGNVKINRLADQIGGATCGLLAGILSAGITMIGVSMLPLGTSGIGFEPGQESPPDEFKGLFETLFAMNRITERTANYLSTGSMAPVFGQPLAVTHPSVIYEAMLTQRKADPDSLESADPGSVRVTGVHIIEQLPANLDPKIVKAIGDLNGYQLVAVDAEFDQIAGTYDSDNSLRIPYPHIQLRDRLADGSYTLRPAIGFSWMDPRDRSVRKFFGNNVDGMIGSNSVEQITFLYRVPSSDEPRDFWFRKLRLPLQQPINPPADTLALLGAPGTVPQDLQDSKTAGVGEATTTAGVKTFSIEGLDDVTFTSALPQVFNLNSVKGPLNIETLQNHSVVISGEGTAYKAASAMGAIRVTEIVTPATKVLLRVKMTKYQAKSMIGQIGQFAGTITPIIITDDQGNPFTPYAYATLNQGGDQRIRVGGDIMTNLPLPTMDPGDDLYLYFAVYPGTRLVKMSHAATEQTLDILVPKPNEIDQN